MPTTIFIVTIADYEPVPLASFTDRADAEQYRATRQADAPAETFDIEELALFAPGEQPEQQTIHTRIGLVGADGSLTHDESSSHRHFGDELQDRYPPLFRELCYEPGLPAGTRRIQVDGADLERVEQRYTELLAQARDEIAGVRPTTPRSRHR